MTCPMYVHECVPPIILWELPLLFLVVIFILSILSSMGAPDQRLVGVLIGLRA